MQMRLFPYTNSGLFSNHYLETRVKQQLDEWKDDASAKAAFAKLKGIFKKERDLLKTYNEAQLESNFIKPILNDVLGHCFEVQESTFKSSKRPDYAFFPDEQTRREAHKHKGKDDFYKTAIAVGDAKALGTPLSKKSRSKEAYTYENPSLQIDIYLRETPPEWGILTDGQYWRLYYEKTSHKLDSYFEIDLFDISSRDDLEAFKYFYLFFRLVAFVKVKATSKCFLDRVYEGSIEYAKELGEELKQNVYEALKVLAQGFIAWKDNKLKSDNNALEAIRQNSLVLLYRLLFIFYAESRGLLNKDHPYYSLDSLKKEIAEKLRRGEKFEKWTPHYWQRLKEFFSLINEGSEAKGIPKEELFIPPYNGGLFDPKENEFLEEKTIGDHYLAIIINLLARARTNGEGLGFVDYSTLDVRHLGSIYEGLLEYKLRITVEDLVAISEKGKEKWIPLHDFKGDLARISEDRRVKAGEIYLATDKGERKATGSYYTPDFIVKYIVKNTLGPLLEEKKKLAGKDPDELIQEIYRTRVLDPAMGSGHFLVEATDFLARALVEAYGESPREIAEEDIRWARREVIERCIFGVDLNPLAVELSKLSIWLMTVAKDKPLSFLDHHLRCGNSLMGVRVRDLGTLPTLKQTKAIDKGAKGQVTVFDAQFKRNLGELLRVFEKIEATPSDDMKKVQEKKHQYYEIFRPDVRPFIDIANLWLSAYFGNEFGRAEYSELQNKLVAPAEDWSSAQKQEWFKKGVEIASEKRFFHWELEFPEVFFGARQKNPGFDAVVGNPPWERVKLQENEFFSDRDYTIAHAPTAAKRKELIKQLPQTRPELWIEYEQAKEAADRTLAFFHKSGQYPLMGRGDTNYYAVFAERALRLLNPQGRGGFVVPSGIATDSTSQYFLQELVDNKRLAYLIDFENRKEVFEGVHRSFKFTLIGVRGKGIQMPTITCASFLHTEKDLRDNDRVYELTPEDFALLNPNTRTAPIFRTKKDVELTKKIYASTPVLLDTSNPKAPKDPWGVKFVRMFDMTNDSGLFMTKKQLEAEGHWLGDGNVFTKGERRYLPLYEGKMVQMFDHRAATIVVNPENLVRPASPEPSSLEEHKNPRYSPLPQFWVLESEVNARLEDYNLNWFIAYKHVTSPTNARSMIAAMIPKTGAGNSLPLIIASKLNNGSEVACLLGNLCSFCLDYALRQKVGGQNLNFFIIEQLPLFGPTAYNSTFKGIRLRDFIARRVLELTYTSHDIRSFAQDLGYNKDPFPWDEERRLHLLCQLDAIFCHLYGLDEADISYILDTFPIIRDEDIARFGSYRTKELIMSYYRAYAAGNMDAWVKG